ncbi:MAG: hypothetical protein IRZ16_05275 [Myxococcaceae bacterium]|nr:hypothetical protein [Myxococcaceae bacterium]
MPRAEIPLIDGPVRAAWQRRDLVIGLLHDERCPPCAAARRLLRTRAGLPDDPELALAVFTRGAPEDAHVVERLGRAAQLPDDVAAILIADRFLELYATLDVHAIAPEALGQEVGAWAEAVLLQCGECSRMPETGAAATEVRPG